MSGRDQSELESVVGAFVNYLPLRFRVDAEMRFSGLLHEVRDLVTDCFDHAQFRYEDLLADLEKDRQRGGDRQVADTGGVYLPAGFCPSHDCGWGCDDRRSFGQPRSASSADCLYGGASGWMASFLRSGQSLWFAGNAGFACWKISSGCWKWSRRQRKNRRPQIALRAGLAADQLRRLDENISTGVNGHVEVAGRRGEDSGDGVSATVLAAGLFKSRRRGVPCSDPFAA